MNSEMQKPETVEAYMLMAKQFAWLVDAELTKLERDAQAGDLHTVTHRLPALISTINTVGYLRGQDGLFLDFRPGDLAGDCQRQLYAAEDAVEGRLWRLIDLVWKDENSQKEYLAKLQTYYIHARTPK